MRKLTHEEENQIIELYVQQKKSSLEVSKLVGYSATLVTKVIKRRGFEVRSISKAMSGKKRPNSFPVSKSLNTITMECHLIKSQIKLDVQERV